jgi:hypothetical protein
MSLISKQLIWAEIETLEIVLVIARRNGLAETHPFMWELLRYKQRVAGDLIEATDEPKRA